MNLYGPRGFHALRTDSVIYSPFVDDASCTYCAILTVTLVIILTKANAFLADPSASLRRRQKIRQGPQMDLRVRVREGRRRKARSQAMWCQKQVCHCIHQPHRDYVRVLTS